MGKLLIDNEMPYTGLVSYDILRRNGYSDEDITEGALMRFTEGNVIWHVYLDEVNDDDEEAIFLVYWPSDIA